MDRQACLKSAIAHLKEAYEALMHAQTPGSGFPDHETLQKAARATAEAHLQLEHLLMPADPYADRNLRPGLNFHEGSVGDAAARGMIAPPHRE